MNPDTYDPSFIDSAVRALVPGLADREKIFAAVAKKAQFGYDFATADASLRLLIARVLDGKKLPFRVTFYHVSMRGSMENGEEGNSEPRHVCEASIKVIVGGAEYHTVSEGNGPISALDGALRLALGRQFSNRLEHITLVDFSVHLVGGRATGTDAKTRVLVATSDGTQTWRTMGVGNNVVEASLLALIDALEFALLPARMRK